jgi:four helix bundle protein
MKQSALTIKSYAFALRMVKMYSHLSSEKKEFVLSKQCLRSGTAIGALVREAAYAQSPADFIHKLSIAAKEANETDYWLQLLKDSEFLKESQYTSINSDCKELLRLLTASIKTSKARL